VNPVPTVPVLAVSTGNERETVEMRTVRMTMVVAAAAMAAGAVVACSSAWQPTGLEAPQQPASAETVAFLAGGGGPAGGAWVETTRGVEGHTVRRAGMSRTREGGRARDGAAMPLRWTIWELTG
jgi:hypothetical protein